MIRLMMATVIALLASGCAKAPDSRPLVCTTHGDLTECGEDGPV